MHERHLMPWRRRGLLPAFFDLDIENFFDNFYDFLNPSAIRIDMKETEKEYILEADLPGFDKNNIEIHHEGNMLTISGKQDEIVEEKRENYIHKERRRGSFSRTIPLPDNVDADNIKASYTNGVLRLILPKINPSKPKGRKIDIE